ncbi:hypothetical protein FKM82_026550 [Ascaphus truei]
MTQAPLISLLIGSNQFLQEPLVINVRILRSHSFHFLHWTNTEPSLDRRGQALLAFHRFLPMLSPHQDVAVPSIGPSLQKPFQEYLEAQRKKLHHKTDSGVTQSENWLSWAFEKLVIVMVFYFILSIINSMAQSYAKRVQQAKFSLEKTQ